MPRLCEFDKTTFRVVGWYETVLLEYPKLPPADCTLELTDDEWFAHFDDPSDWQVIDGKLERISKDQPK